MGTSLEGIKAVFLDLDGTIYLGGKLIDGALEFLDRCDEQDVQRYFLPNNSCLTFASVSKPKSKAPTALAFGCNTKNFNLYFSTSNLTKLRADTDALEFKKL